MIDIFVEHLIIVVGLIVVTYSLNKLTSKYFDYKLPKQILGIIPILLAIIYNVIGDNDFDTVQKLGYGLAYGSVSSSFYSIVAKNLTKRVEAKLDTILGKAKKKKSRKKKK